MTKRYARRVVGGTQALTKAEVVRCAVRGTEKVIRKQQEQAGDRG